jgi:hypothetical protein
MKYISPIMVVLTLLIACPAGIALAAPKAVFQGTTFNAGEIEQGALLTHGFAFKNSGDAPLMVKVNDCGCGGLTFQTPSQPVKPGQTGVITVNVPTVNRKGAVKRDVSIETNDPDQKSLRLSIFAQVREALSIEPSSIHFGQVGNGAVAKRTIVFTNNTSEPITVLDTQVSPAGVVAIAPTLKKTTLKPGEIREIEVTLPSRSAAANIEGALIIKTDRKTLPEKKVYIRAESAVHKGERS